MIVKTRLAEILDKLTPHLEKVCLKGQGVSSFVYAVNNGRAVEISEDNGGFWLEFWEDSNDEDAAPVKEMTIDTCEQTVQETRRWLGDAMACEITLPRIGDSDGEESPKR